ncbi:MAG: corrinoid protein [Dehalococcoidales bacterium]|nr:corrinoid protein [Dehalococcoidales bacterium]
METSIQVKSERTCEEMDILPEIAENVRHGEAVKVSELVRKGLDDGLSWEILLNEGLFKGMEVVGELFREEEIFIPEVLMAAKAMDAGQKPLEPLIEGAVGGKKMGKVILGTVKGDLHNLGKNLVGVMLKGAGFEVIDLGVDVAAEKFVDAVVSGKARLVGMSALITPTMPYLKTAIDALHEAGLKGQVKTIIGGACVTQQYADEIGADAYGDNAGEAVEKAKKLLG